MKSRPASGYQLWNSLYTSMHGPMGDPGAHAMRFHQSVTTADEGITGAPGFDPSDFTAGTISMVSADAGDAAAGVGAQTIRIHGVDANNAEISETMTLAGLTPVVSTKSFKHINSGDILTVGASGFPEGIITFTKGSSVVAGVVAGVSVPFLHLPTSAFMVPAGKQVVGASFYSIPAVATLSTHSLVRITGSDVTTERPAALQFVGSTTVPIVSPQIVTAAPGLILANPGDLLFIRSSSASIRSGMIYYALRDL